MNPPYRARDRPLPADTPWLNNTLTLRKEMVNSGYSDCTLRITYAATVNSSADVVYGDNGNPNEVVLTWKRTSQNSFPVIDMILAVLLFVKIATAYMDYRKHGQFEFTAPAILFACLLFALTAPSYIWSILG